MAFRNLQSNDDAYKCKTQLQSNSKQTTKKKKTRADFIIADTWSVFEKWIFLYIKVSFARMDEKKKER